MWNLLLDKEKILMFLEEIIFLDCSWKTASNCHRSLSVAATQLVAKYPHLLSKEDQKTDVEKLYSTIRSEAGKNSRKHKDKKRSNLNQETLDAVEKITAKKYLWFKHDAKLQKQ